MKLNPQQEYALALLIKAVSESARVGLFTRIGEVNNCNGVVISDFYEALHEFEQTLDDLTVS